jgi:hypothetical protein
MIMRRTLSAALFGASVLITVPALGQTANPSSKASSSATPSGPADLCQELLAYAEKKAAEPSKAQAGQAPASAAAPPPRSDEHGSGTQGGGSVGPSSLRDTSAQPAAPPIVPATPGATSEPATSPHAADPARASGAAQGTAEIKLAGEVTLQQVRDTAKRGDRQACRETAQKLRRAGADLPADLIALAAYEPDPAIRQ